MIGELAKSGARVDIFDGDIPTEVENAVTHLRMRQLIVETGDGIEAAPAHLDLMRYYAASVDDLLDVARTR